MLATVIILSIIVAIAIVIFAVKAANIKNAIEDIYAKQALLQENSRDHEDRINVNYKSLAELNRRQDEFEKAENSRYSDMRGSIRGLHAESSHDIKQLRNDTMPAIKALQDYNAEREKKAKEAVEEFENTMNCIVEIARKRAKKAAKAKETTATEKAQAPDTPATAPRETRDAKQTAAANRAHFAEYRTVMSVREAAKELGVSLTTAKRYEKWRKSQEQ